MKLTFDRHSAALPLLLLLLGSAPLTMSAQEGGVVPAPSSWSFSASTPNRARMVLLMKRRRALISTPWPRPRPLLATMPRPPFRGRHGPCF